MSRQTARIRRLLGDLSRSDSRGDALRRIRRRAVTEVRKRTIGGPGPAASATDPRYVDGWSRLARAVTGESVAAPAGAMDRGVAEGVEKRAALARGEAVLAEAIARGEPLERAVCSTVAALTDALEWHSAWAIAEGVGRTAGGERASRMGHALLEHRRRLFERVWTRISDLDDEGLAEFIPVEAVDGALWARTEEGRRKALAIAARMEGMSAPVLADLAGRLLAFGEHDAAAALIAELRRRPAADLDDRRRYAAKLIEGWLAPSARAVPAGAIPLGVIDYQTPDHVLTSGNVGDYIQTLALLGNLARFSGVTFSGEDGLGDVADDLKARVRPDLRRPDVAGRVHLVPIDRDFSTAEDIPPGTWMVAFGWHMHPLFDVRYDFPYHENVRPLFLSFHVNRLEMLSEAAKDYLRRYGPIGCRDWTTVFLLLSAGIDAFFTGCLTTTVDAVFPSRAEAYTGNGHIGIIDKPGRRLPDTATARRYSHQADEYRFMSAAEGVRAASKILASYQRDLAHAVTGRLHGYLPLTSLGVPVEFAISRPGDVRFAGLTGLEPDSPRLNEMRDGIRDLLAKTLEKVISGAAEADVYASWRDLTSSRVAEARALFKAPVVDEPTTVDIASAAETSLRAQQRFGPHDAVDKSTVTDVVLAFDQNLLWPAAVLVESIVSNASGPVRLWVLGRGLPDGYPAWLAGAFPDLPITVLPCDHIGFGGGGRPRRIPARITISTMDRILLPRMLDDIERVVYLDVDTICLGDVTQLATMDLGGRPIAARDSNVSETSEWQRAGGRLPEELASELRRRMGFAHGFGHPALNAGALVLDLQRMRHDDFTATALGLIERYGLNDQDSMLAYVGPERAVIEPRWNALPVLEDVPDPSLIHWASLGKPWEPMLTFAKDRWQPYADRVHQRAGMPPEAPTPN